MEFDHVLKVMKATKTPMIAVLRDGYPEKYPVFVTIIRPTDQELQFVQIQNGQNYGHLSSKDMLSDKWEWA